MAGPQKAYFQKRLGYKENNTTCMEVCPESLGAMLEY